MADKAKWREGFDAVEQVVTPRLDALMHSDQFAVVVGLLARIQRGVEQEAARSTRRVLHRLNLPAGTDVSRILTELGQLKLQVRDLTHKLAVAEGRTIDASASEGDKLPPRRSTGGDHGVDSRSRRTRGQGAA
ncbi:MAG: hypothetical protein ABIQ39_00680 [Ilumatobacteraceae bacterium]